MEIFPAECIVNGLSVGHEVSPIRLRSNTKVILYSDLDVKQDQIAV